MNIKRAFLAAIAVLMMPGLAMAQSDHTFAVSVMDDDGAVSGVELNLTCNAGVPLMQDGTSPVTFSLLGVGPATPAPECDLTVTGGLDDGIGVTGYSADMGTPVLTGCNFVLDGSILRHTCDITVGTAPIGFEAFVVWSIDDQAPPNSYENAEIVMTCMDGSGTLTTQFAADPDTVEDMVDEDTDEPIPFLLANVVPPADCYAEIINVGSAVETTGCEDTTLAIDPEDSEDNPCTIFAGTFFEGIPTLSQYGMAIMALLMLGVGFVGFRRFV